ncbi:HI1450 family dsDNA-mimic protein [Pasteurella atlantica]|uniref:HI1450 family dsDNA-mimic protein n=1 Tax=Pasteurellaceae TaxID=712 RepID=UPI00276D28CD|nr:HI1450 family dsDNA-mimic protein [Pasteurella atlantica]MDP8033366.1 HI1450 family dsDNA-mimic protein [Pasteurella atlantica]MDP8035302.1 HI1450 family dsDNA-mimic protein [Pasteurella atlantica]MDP8037252.1 HI1450 family dsDNA-mimic protein [Pasteurella atlantica]MDP8047634.1 HI1450 family dsDNA-mimic protein [Pasteurella atlantica]MDP8049555.1 HI1450 family dsDNA-mimic protein [Pasteurella atlantica]
MDNVTKLTPDEAIDIAYDIFLEMAGENLDPADILLFNLQFEECGAVEMVETSEKWEQEIGVLIDPDAFAEVWIGLINDNDEMDNVFARFLISHQAENREYHIIWKE